MALTNVKFRYPGFLPRNANAQASFSSSLLDAAGEKLAWIIQAPKAGTISKVCFRSSTVTSSGDADVRLETVDGATGAPSGSLFGTNTNATQTVSTSNTWWTTTLTAGAVVTQGQDLAVVIANTTGTYNITYGGVTLWVSNYPYMQVNTGAWVKTAGVPVTAFEYNDGSYGYIADALPYSAFTNTAFNNSSNPDERGIKFRLPFSARVVGAEVVLDADAACDIVLYGSDGTTVLTSRSLDSDVRFGANGGNLAVRFPASQTLLANTDYRMTVLPTSGSNVTISDFAVASAAIWDAVDGGADFHLTTRNNAGAWTDTTTSRTLMALLIDAVDLGGLKTHPGMSGGMAA